MQRFENKVVLVTGAAAGIGKSTAERIAAEGGRVVCTDVQAEAVETTAKEIQSSGGEALALVSDVSDPASANEAVARTLEAYSRLDSLCNIAGILQFDHTHELDLSKWNRILNVNLTGTYNFTRAVSPIMMRQREGRIVSIASVIGLSGNAGQANYAASKAGVIAMTKSVARELGGRSVTVNAIAPGFIATDMTAKLDERVKSDMLKSIALKRFGEGKDIAAVVAFLLSEGASYITGQTLVCDGGMVY